ncbi:6-phosphogluconate dehydrogenase C-terminal domain-like protein [Athelia psychrophila]|uniref:6-phosphogluconate dehydrogenase C-terminal domain-like protein n=1 Tax=Athelia psychrophila TaxID=1759441 RepID=A0A166CJ12_9AGAM|nr:6-phosphogluconate dehydrogenase C-terminal domain-like protein [Fibularhizoctonia sp. CBS 109695]
MSAPVKDVLLIGLGAVGSVYALVLKRSGLVRVTAVARSNYATIERDGLHIKSARYGEQVGWRPDRLCNSVASAADRAYSHVILTTKALPDVSPTSALLAPLLASPYSDKFDQPTYVFLQNGLNVEADVYGVLERLGKGAPKVVSTAVYIAATIVGDNFVEHGDMNDRMSMGMYHPDTSTTSSSPPPPALTDLQEMLEKGGVDSTFTIVPSIYTVKFAKNFWNIVWSCTATLTTYPLPSLWRPPPKDGEVYQNGVYVSESTRKWVEEYTLPNMRAVLEEALSVARAIGIPDLPAPQGIPSSFVDSMIRDTAALHVVASNNHRPSMLVDAQQGGPIEVEVILGEVVREARKRGVSVPRIEMLYALLIVVQNQMLRKMETRKTA